MSGKISENIELNSAARKKARKNAKRKARKNSRKSPYINKILKLAVVSKVGNSYVFKDKKDGKFLFQTLDHWCWYDKLFYEYTVCFIVEKNIKEQRKREYEAELARGVSTVV